MSEKPIYDLQDVAQKFTVKAARRTVLQYRRYGATVEDAVSEMYVWLYDEGRRKVDRWLRSRPQQTTRIYYSLYDVGMKYGESQKAQSLGYSTDDIHFYTRAQVEALIPLALNSHYDGVQALDKVREIDINANVARRSKDLSETGDQLAMVMDVRRAVSAIHNTDPDAICNWLNGQWGQGRRAMTNAHAMAVTGSEWDG